MRVSKLPGLFPDDARLKVKEIGDGNMNYVYRVTDETTNRSVIAKRALPYIRVIGESWPLTADRARIEAKTLILQRAICPENVSRVFHFDRDWALNFMEDLSSFQLLRRGLMEEKRYPRLAEHLGRFLARMLFFTSRLGLNEVERKEKEARFQNPEMAETTTDVVFVGPYFGSELNRWNRSLDAEVRRIRENESLRLEVAKLKDRFMTCPQALIHGNLHTGSVMVTEQETKILDPEFAFFGPIGFDIGAIVANVLLNYASHEVRMNQPDERLDYQRYLLETIKRLWICFEEQFSALCGRESKDPSVQIPGYLTTDLRQTLEDSLGYARCKCCGE